jgi:alcohol dehydrogenase
MQQLAFMEPGRLEWTEVAEPSLETAEAALVRPLVVTTCDLDHLIISGRVPLPGPFPLGHEFVAEVVETGDAVGRVRRGDRVIVPFQISCGHCDRCRRGLTGACRSAPVRSAYGLGPIGGLQWGGALADLVRVPFADAMLAPLPAGVAPTAIASASDNLCDAWRTVAPFLAEEPGADVLVVGGGAISISLYAVAVAKALGAGRVLFLDTDPGRAAVAERLGAEVAVGASPKRAGEFPITVDASGDADGLACALRSVTPYGTCTSAAIYYTDTVVPLLEMYGRGVRFITGRVNARAHLPAVLELVATGRLDPAPVNTATVPWRDAIDGLLNGGSKPVIVRDGVLA